jgi:hypothetical protein
MGRVKEGKCGGNNYTLIYVNVKVRTFKLFQEWGTGDKRE